MKYILIIGDGMADNPVPELDGKTPLQAAHIPSINALAARGQVGSVSTVPPGLPPGSDTAILSIFGADPRECYTGRSPLEAAGSGVILAPGEVSYRCNMVAYEESDLPFAQKKILSHSAGSIDGHASIELISFLFSHPDFQPLAQAAEMLVHPNPSFRHIAVQAGANIDGLVATPPHNVLGQAIGPYLPTGCPNAGTLSLLMERAHTVLSEHPVNAARRAAGKLPANGIWFWAEGTAVTLDSFVQRYGKKGAVISAVPLCHGIARLTGLDVILVEGATGELDTNYAGKVNAALDALEEGWDFAAIHVEAPDECTHNGDLPGKLQAIEFLDSRVVTPLAQALQQRAIPYRMLVLSDHKTLTETRGHDGDPVPYLLYDSRIDTKAGRPYSEQSGALGPYLPDGTALMPLLFQDHH